MFPLSSCLRGADVAHHYAHNSGGVRRSAGPCSRPEPATTQVCETMRSSTRIFWKHPFRRNFWTQLDGATRDGVAFCDAPFQRSAWVCSAMSVTARSTTSYTVESAMGCPCAEADTRNQSTDTPTTGDPGFQDGPESTVLCASQLSPSPDLCVSARFCVASYDDAGVSHRQHHGPTLSYRTMCALLVAST